MSKSINLNEKIEYKGFWYLPTKTDIKIAGILTYYPNEKIILELIDTFYENLNQIFGNTSETIIWGITSDSNRISLVDCHGYSSLNFSAGFPITKFRCQYMIVGKHISSIEDKGQYSITFKIPEINLWYRPKAIKSYAYPNNENHSKNIICLSFETEYQNKNNTIKDVELEDGRIISLRQGVNYNATFDFLNPQLEQYTYVSITRKSTSSIWDLLSDMHVFEEFLSLATLSNVYSSEITFFDNELYQQFSGGRYYNPIHFIYPNIERADIIQDANRQPLFTYDSIRDIYADIINSWFNSPSDIYPIRKHLIQSLKRKRIYGSVDFLMIVQAIEGFWWRFKDSEYRLKNNISNKQKTQLKTIISELLSEYNDIELMSKTTFDIAAEVASRHYYSHFLPKNKQPKALDGVDLYNESKKLKMLLVCCMLSFIGIDHSRMNLIFNNSAIKMM